MRSALDKTFAFPGILGQTPAMHRVLDVMNQVVDTDATVLILPESGTGKELVAKAIHYNSPRRERRFVAINCGALPQTLLESELFGYKKGAFTGAKEDRQGLVEAADGGTLFLDEVGNLPAPVQRTLLRFLAEGEIVRVGGAERLRVDVRVITATHRDLARAGERGVFRVELYYRLAVTEIRLPPLRDRREDIPLLVAHFLGSSPTPAP